MNTPNPLVPQGSLLEQQTKSKTKSNLFIAVFLILAIHVVLFGGLLVQGCRQQKPVVVLPTEPTNTPAPAPDTNYVATPATPAAPTGYYTETPTNPAQPTTSGPMVSTPATTIPTTAAADTGATLGGTQSYTVVKNDTFGKIAKDHGTTIAALAKANPTANSTKLRVGQVLQLPAATDTTLADAASRSSKTASASDMTSYTVKAGDTLTRVAKTHATTVVAIRKANHLKTDQLHVGQKLKIPAPKSAKTAEPASTASLPSSEPAMPAPAPVPAVPAGTGRL